MPLLKYNGLKTPRAHARRSPSAGMVVLGVLLLLAARPAAAQRVTGPWDDASIAPRGVLRIGITPRFNQWNERFDASGERVPLGSALTVDSLGRTGIPFLAGLASPLMTLTGLPAPPLSLGTLQTTLDVTETRTDITLDYSLTSRLGVQLLVPYVKNRVHARPRLNEGGLGATLGFNPAQAVAAARQQNDLVVGAIGSATATLSAELTRCDGSLDPTCAVINADRPGAMTLVQTAGLVATAVSDVYGSATTAGALYAPVAGSILHQSVDARLTALNAQFQAFLGASPGGAWIGTRPVAAVPMAAGDLEELLGGDASGLGARPLSDYEHSHVGDIEVGAKLLLLDTFGPPATGALPRAGALRFAIAGVYRLGTGQTDLPYDFTDVGTGDGQADLELRGHGDIALGPRLWVSGSLRLGVQRPDNLVRRIPDADRDVILEAAREQDVQRDLGDTMELEVAPRYVPNDEFSISGLYRYRTKGADTYSGMFQVSSADGTPLALDASVLGRNTSQSEHLMGLAVTYSTVRGFARRSAKWPLEVSFIHTQVLSGRNLPRLLSNAIGFRIYRPMRRNALRLVDGEER